MSRTVVKRERGERPSFTLSRDSSSSNGLSHDSSDDVKPRFTVSRAQLQVTAAVQPRVVTANGQQVGGGGARAVSLRREVNTGSGSSSFGGSVIIATSADDGRQVRVQKKRRSGELTASNSSGGGGSSSYGSGAHSFSLQRTVVNESAEGGDEDETMASESLAKRGRFTVDLGSRAQQQQQGRGATFVQPVPVAAPPSTISAASFPRAPSAPIPQPLPGVHFNQSLADKVRQAAAERLSAMALPTNASLASMTRASPAGGGASASPPAAAAAAAPGSLFSGSFIPSAPVAPVGPTGVVLIRNLAPSITAKFLLSHLFPAWDVLELAVDRDEFGQCRGTAEALFAREKDAEEAVRLCNGQQLHAQQVRLSIIRDGLDDSSLLTQAAQQPRAQPTPAAASLAPARPAAAAASAAPIAPAPAAASTAAPSSAHASLFSQPSNVAFAFAGDSPSPNDDSAMDQGGAEEEITFNITNLRGAVAPGTGSSAAAAGPLKLQGASNDTYDEQQQQSHSSSSTSRQPKVVQLRPKSVVVSGAAAMAGVASAAAAPSSSSPFQHATTSGKPSITLSKHATQQSPPASSSSSSSWQPKTVVLAPRR